MNPSEPRTPRTEAGRRLLAKVNREPPLGFLPPEDILAIEAEAGLDVERLARALTDVQGGRYRSWLGRAPLILHALRARDAAKGDTDD